MKFKILFLLSTCFVCFTARAQQNQLYDNTNYKALYFKDAAKLIAKNPHILLLDVRSPGEYADTSARPQLNIGRLKGAINISIDSIKQHLKDLEPYKNKEILVYCSHSQRSRVVSKLLGDNGFTKVNSLNGGMSLVNKSSNADFNVKPALYITHLPYKLIQSVDAYNFIRNKKNVIIDLRPATQFNGTDSVEDYNIGRIKGAMNIPADELDGKMAKLLKYKNTPVMLYDLHNSKSIGAALKLKKAGFKKVYVLFEGLSTLMVNTPSASPLRKELFVNCPKYNIAGSKEAIDIVSKNPNVLIADVRVASQYENKDKVAFMNLGHIKNAVNFTDEASLFAQLKNKSKSTPILIYGSGLSGMAEQDPINTGKISRQLSEMGYKHVYLVYNGLYSVFWSITNVDDCKNGMTILTDHKGLY